METATCIVSLIHEGKIYFGGDSLASVSSEQEILKNPKVFTCTDSGGASWIFGFTGLYRFAQLLQYKLTLATPDSDTDILPFLVREFVPAVQSTLQKEGFAQTEKGRMLGGSALIGVKGRVFVFTENYSLQEPLLPYTALGCGAPYALGSLFSSSTLLPEERMRQALRAAEEFSSGVRGPFTVLSI